MRVPGARRSSQATATVSPAAAIPCRPSRAEAATPFRRAGADQVRPSSVERQARRSPSLRPMARIAVTTAACRVRATRGPRRRPRARRPWLGTRTGAENVRPPSRDPAKRIERSSPKTRPTLRPATASCGCAPGNSAAVGGDARRAMVRAASMAGLLPVKEQSYWIGSAVIVRLRVLWSIRDPEQDLGGHVLLVLLHVRDGDTLPDLDVGRGRDRLALQVFRVGVQPHRDRLAVLGLDLGVRGIHGPDGPERLVLVAGVGPDRPRERRERDERQSDHNLAHLRSPFKLALVFGRRGGSLRASGQEAPGLLLLFVLLATLRVQVLHLLKLGFGDRGQVSDEIDQL